MTEQQAKGIKGFLGLCRRAGQVILGQDACIEAVRKKNAALLVLDESSSETSAKRLRNTCQSYRVPLYCLTQGLLPQALGKEGVKAAAIRNGTMAQKLETLLSEAAINKLTNDDADIAGVQA